MTCRPCATILQKQNPLFIDCLNRFDKPHKRANIMHYGVQKQFL